jgi:hypothetical protein
MNRVLLSTFFIPSFSERIEELKWGEGQVVSFVHIGLGRDVCPFGFI